jgi:hypothetical protein
MTKLTSTTFLATLAAGTLLQGCAAVTTGWQAAAPVQDALTVDPACLASAAWFTDPAEADLQLFGCRSAAALPAPDADGWREFASDDGALVRTRGYIADLRTGAVRVEVIYNGGGSLTVRNLVTGTPDAKGVLKAGAFKVTSLN